jgi:hypothetical protein
MFFGLMKVRVKIKIVISDFVKAFKGSKAFNYYS